MSDKCNTCKYRRCPHFTDDTSCYECEHYSGVDSVKLCKCMFCCYAGYVFNSDKSNKTSYYVEDKTMEDSQIGPKNITARVALYCDECGCEIWEDEEYYYVDNSNICEACIDDHIAKCKRIAEVDDDDDDV